VLSARALDGVNVKTVSVTSDVMVPATPGLTVKVAVLMVAGSIAWGKVATTTVFGHAPEDPLGGVTAMGGAGTRQGLALVVKLHTKLPARVLPYMSVAPVVIVAVYAVPSASVAVGVKVAVSLDAS
jgi:hypothetical protein